MRTVRKTTQEDVRAVLEIYENARKRMRAEGNNGQWITYPNEKSLANDMKKGQSFVVAEEGTVIGTFYFCEEEDATYGYIEGKWKGTGPYGVIHRIAGDGIHRGILLEAVKFALRSVSDIRIDTHRNNISMQTALRKLGFVQCGTIFVHDEFSDHSARVAYELIAKRYPNAIPPYPSIQP